MSSDQTTQSEGGDVPPHLASDRDYVKSRMRVGPIFITLGTVAVAALLAWVTWQVYMGAPWTRDGTVRAYVVTMAPEVAGRIVEADRPPITSSCIRATCCSKSNRRTIASRSRARQARRNAMGRARLCARERDES